MVALTDLTIQQQYIYQSGSYYDFSWNSVQGAEWYELYGNNVLFSPRSLMFASARTFRESDMKVIDSIARATDKPIRDLDTIVFYLVARWYNSQIIGVSNYVRMPVQFLVSAQSPIFFKKSSGIHIFGSLIDCSSLKGPVQILLYSLNGAKVWSKQGVGVKAIVPAYLPSGTYTLEVTGEFGKTSKVFIRQ